jgi:hypothetical protein
MASLQLTVEEEVSQPVIDMLSMELLGVHGIKRSQATTMSVADTCLYMSLGGSNTDNTSSVYIQL